jgi:hypothetical protein
MHERHEFVGPGNLQPVVEVDPKAIRVAEVFMTLAQRGVTLPECLKVIRVIAEERGRRKRRTPAE